MAETCFLLATHPFQLSKRSKHSCGEFQLLGALTFHFLVQWIEFHPSERRIYVPTPGPQGVALLGNRVLADVIGQDEVVLE